MKARLIARLDIKGRNLIKGIQLEGLRVIGDPNLFAMKYFKDGIDEFVFMDSVATLYGRNQLGEIIEEISENIFVPITVGGGLRTLEDCRKALRSGADKVAINSAAVTNNNLISEVAYEFGSQCMVASIDAKQVGKSNWHVYTSNGRESTGIDVVEWAAKCERLGAGEILLTSIDREGTRSGFDNQLVGVVTNSVGIPIIASGGLGSTTDLLDIFSQTQVDAVAIADALHYGRVSISALRESGINAGREMRIIENE